MSDIISQCQEQISDFPGSSTALALRLLQEADNFVLLRCRLFGETQFTVNLTSGIGYYALDPSVLRVWAATYYDSSGGYTPMIWTSYDDLDYNNQTWRDQASGQPVEFFDLGPTLGIWPSPVNTTAAGYPIIKIYTSTSRVLTTGTAMPPQVPDYNVWVSRALYTFALKRHPDQAAALKVQTADYLNELLNYQSGRQARLKPSVEIAIPRPKRA